MIKGQSKSGCLRGLTLEGVSREWHWTHHGGTKICDGHLSIETHWANRFDSQLRLFFDKLLNLVTLLTFFLVKVFSQFVKVEGLGVRFRFTNIN